MKKYVIGLLLSVTALLVIGIVMLFSTGAFARDAHGDPVYFVKRQIAWLVVATIGCLITAQVDYKKWRQYWPVLFGTSVVLLVLCFVPHIGMKINGSHRWIGVPKVGTIQPSELAKLAALAFLASWLSTYRQETQRLGKGHWKEFAVQGFGIPVLGVCMLMALIVAEVDLGTTALIGCTSFLMMYVAGTNGFVIFPLSLCSLGGLLLVAMHMKERLGRMLAFLDLEHYKQNVGLQQWEALIAFGSGGVDGLGLGCGRQKMQFLPYAHTDFIFPMIGEELGLVWTLFIVAAYVVMIVCGMGIALNSKEPFGMLFGFGVTTILGLQAMVNIGVTTALLPNKGLPLPFISYGGSNLLFCMLCIGILLNIYRHGDNERTLPPLKKYNSIVMRRL